MLTRQMYGFGDVANDTWPSTGEIDSETTSLALTIRQFKQDAFDQGLPGWDSGGFQNAWNTFINDWNQWVNQGYYWNPGRRDQLLAYRKRFNDLVELSKAAGTTSLVTPGQVGGTTLAPDAFDKASDLLTKGLYVVLGVGALWAAHIVYKEVRGR